MASESAHPSSPTEADDKHEAAAFTPRGVLTSGTGTDSGKRATSSPPIIEGPASNSAMFYCKLVAWKSDLGWPFRMPGWSPSSVYVIDGMKPLSAAPGTAVFASVNLHLAELSRQPPESISRLLDRKCSSGNLFRAGGLLPTYVEADSTCVVWAVLRKVAGGKQRFLVAHVLPWEGSTPLAVEKMLAEGDEGGDLIRAAPDAWFLFEHVRTRQRAFLCLDPPPSATPVASRDGELFPIIALDSDPLDTCPMQLLWPVHDADAAVESEVMEWARGFMTDHPIVTMVAIGKDEHGFAVGVGVASLEWDSPDAAAWPSVVAGLRVVRFNHIITHCAGVRPDGPLPPHPQPVVRTPGAILSSPIGPMLEAADGWFFTAGVVALDHHDRPHLVSVGHGVRGEEGRRVVSCPENYREWVHRDAFLNAFANAGRMVAATFRQHQNFNRAWNELPAADRGAFLAHPPPTCSAVQAIGNVMQSSMRHAHEAFVFEYSTVALDPEVAADGGDGPVATAVWDPATPLPGLPSAIGATTGRVDCLEFRGRSATRPLSSGAELSRLVGGPYANVLVLNRGDSPALRKGDSGACLFKETAAGDVIAIGILGQTDNMGNAYFFPLAPILECSNLRIP